MKNLSYIGSHCYSSSNNMAGAGDDCTPLNNMAGGAEDEYAPFMFSHMAAGATDYYAPFLFTNMAAGGAGDDYAPSLFNNMAGAGGTGDDYAPFMLNNMAGAGSARDDYAPFQFNNMDPLSGSSSMVGARDYGTPLDNMAGAGDDGMPFLFSDFVDLEAEVVAAVPVEFEALANVVTRKRGAERMEVATVEPAAAGSKRQSTPTGWKETTGGGDDEQVLEEVAGNGGGGAPRRLWTKGHDGSWWDEVSSSWYPAEEFKRLFRMSPATFEMVCGELAAAVAKNDTTLRQAVPVCKRVAVCIWCLATGEPLRLVAKRFGVGISTCHKISIEICAAIKALLLPKFLLWPKGAPATAIAAEFEATYGIPNIAGAVYNTHISIIAPTSDIISYYNPHHSKRRKRASYSVTVQAVVDAAGSFTDICVGHPGSMSDEEVLRQSLLSKQRGETGLLQAEGKWLVGGASYPVKDWMLAPYVGENLTLVQNMFNSKVAGVRKVAKDAAMRFKARWKLLRKRNEMNVENFPITLSACCVLHNICERYGDTLDPELSFDLVDDEVLAEKPVHSEAASLVRDNIANYLFLSGAVGDIMSYY